MALYKLKTYKHMNDFDGERWENVYVINVAGPASDVQPFGEAIVARERAVSYDTVSFDGFAVFPNAGGPAGYKQIGYVGQGDLASAGLGGPLPLFNTVKVAFSNAVGRPELKYLRIGANADNLSAGHWSSELTDLIFDEYVTPLLAIAPYVGPSGEAHTAGSVQTAVQMRQLSWHRASRPGYHRGWVPD